MEASRNFRGECGQQGMLGEIVNDLADGQMEGDFRADDITGMLVMSAKTVIDCLDA